MYEIEAKVQLSYAEYKALKHRLAKEMHFLGRQHKLDTYYGDIHREQIRVREQREETTFDLKIRKTQKGLEQNLELTWPLRKVDQFKRVLKKMNIQPRLSKEKRTDSFRWKDYNVELNYVKDLGYFLEIERLVDACEKKPEASIGLLDLFRSLGFNRECLERKPYLQLIQENEPF